MTNTITRSKALEVVINGGEITPEVIEVLTKMKATIDNKTSKDSKAKVQAKADRNAIADKVADYLATVEEGMTITDIINNVNLGTVSAPKVTSSLREDGRFIAEKVGRKSLYRLA